MEKGQVHNTQYAPESASTPNGGQFWTPWHPNDFWLLASVELLRSFDGTPLVLPQIGRNAYAFLNNLDDRALAAVQNAFGASTTAGAGNAGVQQLYGGTPCAGMTAIRKLWNPQIERSTTSDSNTFSATAGARGRFGSDWRWDTYYQYGGTDSVSRQFNVATNLRMAFAMGAVIDDRPTDTRRFLPDGSANTNFGGPNPTYGTPICGSSATRAVAEWPGRPLSLPAELASLGMGCKPLNLFGVAYATQGLWR